MDSKSPDSPPTFRCRHCFYEGRITPVFIFEIFDIQSEEAEWILKGKGNFDENTTQTLNVYKTLRCKRCGELFVLLGKEIPVECAPFPCPKCGEQQDLEFKIEHIAMEEDSFTFEAKISCKRCNKKKSLKNILQKILEVVKISVGPTGVTVSKS